MANAAFEPTYAIQGQMGGGRMFVEGFGKVRAKNSSTTWIAMSKKNQLFVCPPLV